MSSSQGKLWMDGGTDKDETIGHLEQMSKKVILQTEISWNTLNISMYDRKKDLKPAYYTCSKILQ